MEHHEETGCQAPEGPILCINNCGFFGSAATMNMCSKCHKDMVLKQEQAKLAASSIDNLVNGSGSMISATTTKEISISISEPNTVHAQISSISSSETIETELPKPKAGPTRCSTCNKKVGLTGFDCRCGHVFCSTHRYSDKHECTYDYRTAGREAIAKANCVVKAEKLDKI